MEAKIHHHPVFVSGQYLTNEHLNETRRFLWQQELCTRKSLIGQGIISGLHPGFIGNPVINSISLSEGAGITREGLVLDVEALSFDRVRPQKMILVKVKNESAQLMTEEQYELRKSQLSNATVTTLGASELFLTTVGENEVPEGVIPINKGNFTATLLMNQTVLLCWIEIVDVENEECEQGSCNSKGIRRHYNRRYFLVPSEDLDLHNNYYAEIPLVRTSRIKNMSLAGSLAGYQKSILDAWKAAVANLTPYFGKGSASKDLNSIAKLLGSNEQLSWKEATIQYQQLIQSSADAQVQQYYVGFADDIAQAINELLTFYHAYIRQHHQASSDLIAQTIVFGGFDNNPKDAWRYYFKSISTASEVSKQEHLLRQLFLRLCNMVICFIPYNELIKLLLDRKEVMAIPDNLLGSLDQRSIPYYYDLRNRNKSVLAYWNSWSSQPENVFSYHDKTLPDRANNPNLFEQLKTTSWFRSDFFRIEGHLGMSLSTAKAAITKLINDEGLPIQLLDCSVDYKGSTKWLDWYNNFFVFVKDNLSVLRKDPKAKIYSFDPLKNIQTNINQVSYRDVDQVTKLFNDFNAYNGVFYNSASKEKEVLKKDTTKKSTKDVGFKLTEDIISAYKNVFTTQKYKPIFDGYYEAIKEINDPGKQDLLTLKDLHGLEYLGGVHKGGTFVLLHSAGKVIGDGALPYFYKIEKARLM